MKTYRFFHEDKDKNELATKDYQFNSIKEAREHARKLYAESCMNDLHKIRVALKS